jgi:hypothetical protein
LRLSYHFVIAGGRTKTAESIGVKRYWEIIADISSKAGWSWGSVSTVDSEGRTIWIVDAREAASRAFWRKKRFEVRAVRHRRAKHATSPVRIRRNALLSLIP